MARLRLGVLGGTFDPVHLGHLVLAHCAAAQLELDTVLFVPAGDPWRKAALPVSPGTQRLEMVRLAVASDARFRVDDRELRREGPTYTVDTLRELRAGLGPDDALFMLMGDDALQDMRYWRDPEGMVAVARLAVAPRGPTSVAPPPDNGASHPFTIPDHDRIDMPYIGISSTDLRERVRRGEGLRYLVPDAVEEYVRKQGLYL